MKTVKSDRWRKPHGVTYELHPKAEKWIIKRLTTVRGKSLSHAWKMIEYLCQQHAGPKNDGQSFVLCRRALARSKLGLSEWQVRTTIKLMVQLGLVVQLSPTGNRYRQTAVGIRKTPIVYQLPSELIGLFRSARKAPPKCKSFTAKPMHLGCSKKQPSLVSSPPPSNQKPFDPTNPLHANLLRLGAGVQQRDQASRQGEGAEGAITGDGNTADPESSLSTIAA